jgi:UDP-GlcNAc3NAcA epimerase
MKIITIVGTRPQFIKAGPVSKAIALYNDSAQKDDLKIEESLVHTGQHYDRGMSAVFFETLHLTVPKYNLGVGSGSHGKQLGKMFEGLEGVLEAERPDLVLVYGDTNSTLAGALVADRLQIPVAHVEAGLRSFISHGEIAEKESTILQRLGLPRKSYSLATIHRAENTDDPGRLSGIIDALLEISRSQPIIWPMHPRTRQRLYTGRFSRLVTGGLTITDPVPYLDMLLLEKAANVVLTDSGCVQKEAMWFRVPCITLRDETEWVETVECGWNLIAGSDQGTILLAFEKALQVSKSQVRDQVPSSLRASSLSTNYISSSQNERENEPLPSKCESFF